MGASRFALRIGPGEAVLTKQVTLAAPPLGMDVVLLGTEPLGSSRSTDIDLGGGSIWAFASGKTQGHSVSLCLEDLKLVNGKASLMQYSTGRETQSVVRRPQGTIVVPHCQL